MEESDRLANRNDLAKTENQRIARFVNGMRVVIQDQVSLQPLYLLSEAITLAKKVEFQQSRSNMKSQYSNRSSLDSSHSTTNKKKQSVVSQPLQSLGIKEVSVGSS